jgi:hypothetical protein
MVIGTQRKLRGCLPLFVTFVLMLLVPGRIYPQVAGATLSGTVTDQSGAVISIRATIQASAPCRFGPLRPAWYFRDN